MDLRFSAGANRHGGRPRQQVILLDVNILLYAYAQSADPLLRKAARKHLETIFSETEPIGLSLQCVYAFLRLTTQPALAREGASMEDSIDTVDEWLTLPHVQLLYPGPRHWELVKRVTLQARASGNLLTDATRPAPARDYGAVGHTENSDFARFSGVRWLNPFHE